MNSIDDKEKTRTQLDVNSTVINGAVEKLADGTLKFTPNGLTCLELSKQKSDPDSVFILAPNKVLECMVCLLNGLIENGIHVDRYLQEQLEESGFYGEEAMLELRRTLRDILENFGVDSELNDELGPYTGDA